MILVGESEGEGEILIFFPSVNDKEISDCASDKFAKIDITAFAELSLLSLCHLFFVVEEGAGIFLDLVFAFFIAIKDPDH